MATRRRSTSPTRSTRSTRTTTRSRTTRSRSRTGYSTRRRTPRLSTSLGGAVAVAAVALLGKLSWGARIGLIVVVLLAVIGFELWTRRGQIAEEISAEQARTQTDAHTDPQSDPQTGPEPPAQPGAPS